MGRGLPSLFGENKYFLAVKGDPIVNRYVQFGCSGDLAFSCNYVQSSILKGKKVPFEKEIFFFRMTRIANPCRQLLYCSCIRMTHCVKIFWFHGTSFEVFTSRYSMLPPSSLQPEDGGSMDF
jgi:hypothetical protein